MIDAQCVGFLNTPPLWEKEQFDIRQFDFPNVDWAEFQPQSFPRNIRLGHQMEHVFQQLVEYSESYDVVLNNLPIRNKGITIGEIDFVLKEKTSDKFIHVELTYKFYLINPEISDPIQSLIGPNKRDSFFAKMEKTKHKQFPLLHSIEAINALNDSDINHSEIEHQCCFKAQLFYPFGSEDVNIGALNRNCLYGYWLRMKEFNSSTFSNAEFYMPSKSEWVITPNNKVNWKSHADILIEINLSLQNEKAPMIWMKKANSTFEKLFVVWW